MKRRYYHQESVRLLTSPQRPGCQRHQFFWIMRHTLLVQSRRRSCVRLDRVNSKAKGFLRSWERFANVCEQRWPTHFGVLFIDAFQQWYVICAVICFASIAGCSGALGAPGACTAGRGSAAPAGSPSLSALGSTTPPPSGIPVGHANAQPVLSSKEVYGFGNQTRKGQQSQHIHCETTAQLSKQTGNLHRSQGMSSKQMADGYGANYGSSMVDGLELTFIRPVARLLRPPRFGVLQISVTMKWCHPCR